VQHKRLAGIGGRCTNLTVQGPSLDGGGDPVADCRAGLPDAGLPRVAGRSLSRLSFSILIFECGCRLVDKGKLPVTAQLLECLLNLVDVGLSAELACGFVRYDRIRMLVYILDQNILDRRYALVFHRYDKGIPAFFKHWINQSRLLEFILGSVQSLPNIVIERIW
jgi:hypothetical protein